MAKFSRRDPRNKKATRHKERSSRGDSFKRIKDPELKRRKYSPKEYLEVSEGADG